MLVGCPCGWPEKGIFQMDTRIVEQNTKRGTQTFITCDYGAALIQRVYLNDKDGHVDSLRIGGEAMDAIVKAWQDYRASQKEQE